jgi:hypothetical protein
LDIYTDRVQNTAGNVFSITTRDMDIIEFDGDNQM